MRKTYVFCKVTQKMVEKGLEQNPDTGPKSAMIIPPLKPFISPITGEEITCRAQLQRHNRAHGVTNSADYSQEFLDKKRDEREDRILGDTRQDKAERIEAIKQAIHRR